MGSSHHLQISKIVALFLYLKPNSILDIGTGFGKYGVLAKEYLGTREQNQGLVIDGMEGHESYITPLHKFAYNQIFVGDILKLVDTIERKYDLVLLIDVLEHFDKADGNKLLRKLITTHKGIILSTPKYVGVQEDEENPYQQHRSQWSKAELASLGNSYFVPDPISHLVYISSDPAAVSGIRSRYTKEDWRYRVGSIPVINFLYRKLWWNRKHAIKPGE